MGLHRTTDVTLPDLSPPDLARRTSRRWPKFNRTVKLTLPKFRFSSVAVHSKRLVNFGQGRLHDVMLRIIRQIRPHGSRQRPARPCAPAALFATRLVHPIRVVLEMDPWIAKENVCRRVSNQPRHRRVGQRVLAQNRLVTRKIGRQRPIQAKQRTRGESFLPKRMPILQTRVIKFGPAIGLPIGMQRAPVQPGTRRRQKWAGGEHRRHAR